MREVEKSCQSRCSCQHGKWNVESAILRHSIPEWSEHRHVRSSAARYNTMKEDLPGLTPTLQTSCSLHIPGGLDVEFFHALSSSF